VARGNLGAQVLNCNNHNDAKHLDVHSMAQLVYTTHGTVSKTDHYCYVQSTAQLVIWDSFQHRSVA